jgi:hypothetical protein
MKKFISTKFAIHSLLIIFSAVIVFHFLVITGLIPYEIVWGGRLKSKEQMIPFELTSIALNLLMLSMVAIYAELLKVNLSRMVLKVAFWLMFVLFFFNTVGNVFSDSEWEKIIFTPLTLILSLFSLRLAIE